MPSSGVEPVASLHSSSSFSMSGSDASSGEEYSLPLQSKSFQSKHQEKTHVQVTPTTDMPASTSTGTTVHIHPAGETLDAPTGRVIKLNVNADSLLVPKEVGGKRPSYYHAESKRARVASKRINFKKEWNRLKLGTHIPPKDLADKVAAMNVVGLQAVGIGKQAKAVVSTHAWPAYSNAYSARKKMLTTGIDTTKKILAKSVSFKNMDSKEQHQYLLHETIKRIDRERVAVQPPQSKRVEERREQTAENTAMVAQLVQSRLDTKQLHLSSVPMDQLEAETRDLKIIGMRSRNFTDYLFRHLRANRKTTEEQLNVFRYARGLHHAKVQGVKTKEKAERKRKPENKAEGASASARRVKTKGGAETNRREGEEA
jgi:hypothetical protein